MTKILVGDDETDLEELIRQKFRKHIREQRYDFVFATNANARSHSRQAAYLHLGGAFLCIVIGFIMRIGAALNGIEVLALYTLKRTSLTITEIILAIKILIFLVAAFNFGAETALYYIFTYFTATPPLH